MEKVAICSCGCPVSGTVEGQLRRGFEQPGLIGGIPAHGRGGELNGL